MKTNQQITLKDGRNLSYQTIGCPDGLPFFFFHGTPGSRLYFSETDKLPAQLKNVFLVLPERPGYGLSTAQKKGTLLDWADDIEQLANHLKMDSFIVAGESGGGAYALACAYKLKQRIKKVLLLCPPAPLHAIHNTKNLSAGNRIAVFLNKYAPWLIRFILSSNRSAFIRQPQLTITALKKQVGDADKKLLDDPAIAAAAIRDLQEAYRSGIEGHIRDNRLLLAAGSWGFSLREISAKVFIWYGTDDTIVPPAMIDYLVAELPYCSLQKIEDAGHFLSDNDFVIQSLKNILLEKTESM
jgi:pimeloyl-ACP methyl ester carboxylesterase